MLPLSKSRRFSIFGFGDSLPRLESGSVDGRKKDGDEKYVSPQILKLETDMDVYRPGDAVWVTIQLDNPRDPNNAGSFERSLLVERLTFEFKGIEKLDTQWFTTQKPLPGSKQRRGEHIIFDCSTSSLISNQIVSPGTVKKFLVRTVLPSILPPSYKGSTIRYLYYVRCAVYGQWLVLENGHSDRDSMAEVSGLEVQLPLQIWIDQKGTALLNEGQSDGILPAELVQPDIYWKEMGGDSDWVRANEIYDQAEDGYESSRDEISSISSYNLAGDSIHKVFGSSLSLRSSSSRFISREALYADADEVLHNSSGGIMSSENSAAVVLPTQKKTYPKLFTGNDGDMEVPSSEGPGEPVASEGFLRGRSYNIRLDDEVLLRFSPKKSDSTYYFSDMIGGTLTFFHEEGTRRCLEVFITLEISESINRRFVHPSRRNSPTITKVHSDYHVVVADVVQTSFLFSIPMDGPMSFSTPHISVQWALRFEFFTTPKNLNWTRYSHPLLVEGRDKCEWVLPITVLAPGASATSSQDRKNLSFDPFWVRE